MAGVFQVDREIFDNSIWQNPAEFRLFFYILGNAVWSEEGVKYGDVLIQRGQYLRSYRNLRNDLMYTENNAIKYYSLSHIKKLVDKLVADGRIEKEDTELGTLFTVVNYTKYQWLQGVREDNQERRKNEERTEREQNENNKNKDNKDNKVNNIYRVLDNYTSSDDLRQALKDFLEMRKKIKKPMTERAFNMLLSKLDELAATDEMKIKLLDQSILHNWQTVYPLKEEKQQEPKQSKPNKFHNFIQSDDYTGDDLEAIAQKRFEKRVIEIKSKQEGKNE